MYLLEIDMVNIVILSPNYVAIVRHKEYYLNMSEKEAGV